MERLRMCVCTCRWGSSDSPGVPQGAPQVKYRATGRSARAATWAFRSRFLLLVLCPHCVAFACHVLLHTTPLLVYFFPSDVDIRGFLFIVSSVRWDEAIWVHWTLYCFSGIVRLLSKTCFYRQPVNLPSSLKIKYSTSCDFHDVMHFRQIQFFISLSDKHQEIFTIPCSDSNNDWLTTVILTF